MRLLFADTDQLFLEILQRYFGRCGHVTEVATNRLDCMAALLDFQPDLLVLDHALSGDPRVAASGQVGADPLLACLPVVLIGDCLDDFHFHAPSPLVAYFRKPFKLHDLLAAIATVPPWIAACGTELRSGISCTSAQRCGKGSAACPGKRDGTVEPIPTTQP